MKSSIKIVFFLSCILFCRCYSTTQDIKPNIIIIVADDLGWNDISLHGSDIKTPNIDRLINEGAKLNRFYTAPICSPTRAGLLSGQYPDRFGIRDGVISPRVKGGLPSKVITIAEVLARVGYEKRAAFGKWHLGHADLAFHPLRQGFTSFYGHYNGALDYFTHERAGELDWHEGYEVSNDQGYTTDLIGQKVKQFIGAANKSSPFFAYVAFNAPHSPMQAKAEDLEDYGYDPNLPTEEYAMGGAQKREFNNPGYASKGRGNTLRQTYAAMVKTLDDGVGAIIRALEKAELDQNTLIWFLSDNGGAPQFGGSNKPLRGGKHSEWEGGVRVISAIRWPGTIQRRTNINQPIAYIDVLPTLRTVVNHEGGLILSDGISVWEAIQGNYLPSRHIFLGHEALVSQKWKFNKGQLFAIESDFAEAHDVAADYPEVTAKLTKMLHSIKKLDKGIKLEKQAADWKPPKNWDFREEE